MGHRHFCCCGALPLKSGCARASSIRINPAHPDLLTSHRSMAYARRVIDQRDQYRARVLLLANSNSDCSISGNAEVASMAKNRRDLTTVVTWCKRTCPELKTPSSSSYNAQPLYLAHLDTRTIKGDRGFIPCYIARRSYLGSRLSRNILRCLRVSSLTP